MSNVKKISPARKRDHAFVRENTQSQILKYFNIKIFIAIVLPTVLLIIVLLVAKSAPRNIVSAVSNYSNKIYLTNRDSTSSYQYAAPWDASLYDRFYATAEKIEDIGIVKGGIVPHHLVSGKISAAFFNYLSSQKPSTIILIGPNHFFRGRGKAITSALDWQTPYGVLTSKKEIIYKLANKKLIEIDEQTIKEEHSIYSIMPFIKKSVPNAKVIPLILRYQTDTTTLDALIKEIFPLLPSDAVIVSSIDFSHYQTKSVADFHDEMTRSVIQNFSYGRLNKLEIDSIPSLYVLLRLMKKMGAQKIAHEISGNSSEYLFNPALKETTSYYSPYFVKCNTDCLSTKSGPAYSKTASILHFGDLMLDRNVKKRIDKYGSDYIFSALAGEENRFFSGVDEIAANLEGPFANSRRSTTKSIAFRFDPILLTTLQKYNFTLFNNANNHTLDMGYEGFSESKANLKKFGFDYYGQQYKISDESSLVKKVGDLNIKYIGLDDTINPIKIDEVKKLIVSTGAPVSPSYKEWAQGESNIDFTIINIHWGEEYKEISNNYQRQLAHQLIDAGADIIIGHHPHVVQEMEIYKNRPIFYSLGNFVFDQYFSTSTQQGLAIGLFLSISNKQKNISAYVWPLQGNDSQVSQMEYLIGKKYLKKWIDKSRLMKYDFNEFNIRISL